MKGRIYKNFGVKTVVSAGCIALISLAQTAAIISAKISNAGLPRSARIQSTTGKVRVQRENYSNTILARQGTELNRGDLLVPDQGVRVTVLCPTGVQRSIAAPSGLETVCPVWRKEAVRGELAADSPRELDDSTPYAQIPRDRLILNTAPTFYWDSSPGATQYHIEVSSPGSVIWSTRTKLTQIVYAGEPLESDVAYTLKVISEQETRSSKTLSKMAVTTKFRVLRPEELATIQATIDELRTDQLADEATALMLATYYQDYSLPQFAIADYGLTPTTAETYSLSSEAITLLEAHIRVMNQQRQTPSATLYRTLGNLYWENGLIERAAGAYTTAIAQVQTPEDLEDWTLSYYGLAQIYSVLNRSQHAAQWFAQARAGFIFLGNLDKAKELTPMIEKLSN
jgi:hypothetical protein